ncbi:AraC family transcriptional regulator [Novosphingobium profundi]|uniref:AraC family transcriptional regulator n=1 Tax=Novosphingobium profundi TaxID=1774954 RepID=UPI001BD94BF0|nr:AraC family transcriptional regulator [Novosphingobium profundi]MBT0668111.1 AraC family transcriptional regulator [Novosphingobium profundi]
MDPLSDVLSLLRPCSHITAGLDAGGAWAIRFEEMGSRIKCYVVTHGGCWLSVDGAGDAVRLDTGDCFVLASGRPFVLAGDLDAPAATPQEVFGDKARHGGVATWNGGGDVFLTGSRFTVEGDHAAMLLNALPPIIHLHTASDRAAMRWSIERMTEELRDGRPGAVMMAEHLSHMMLLQALRLHLPHGGGRPAGWYAGLADPQIAMALSVIHAEPARRWTLAAVASEVGMSRSAFASRFRDQVGETPIAYLARWRMILAGDRLTRSSDTLAQIARKLGYESENAFNTAFKRIMGVSPRRYSKGKPALSRC